jgi:hypothetical protein
MSTCFVFVLDLCILIISTLFMGAVNIQEYSSYAEWVTGQY